jgi:Kef-type K+ transport system membrane component KefB/Trk K+ transport system NAD-binding subunit
MNIFFQLSLIIVAAAVISGFMRLFKQPIIIGYVLTGLLLGPQVLDIFKSPQDLSFFSQMGVAILLFIVGLHLSPKEARKLGKSSFLIGLGQVIFTAAFGFLISYLFGFTFVESLYIGFGLSVSSTIIVLKLLADKQNLEKLFGRITIGITLLQDIVAIVALLFASSFSGGNNSLVTFGLLIVNGILITIGVCLISIYVLPHLSTFFAHSQEYLMLFSLAWGFGLASLFNYLGFSIEIGALIAGVSLSFSPYSQEMSSRLKPLRDFFIVIFFILLGANISFESLSQMIMPVIVLTAFILLIKPLIIMTLMGFSGYNKKTGFLTGIGLAQISEFSIILAMLGVKSGQISTDVLSLITILAVLSIAISTYLVIYAEKIYPVFSNMLRVFEKVGAHKEGHGSSSYEVVLFGCNRAGYDFIKIFRDLGKKFLAVDFDPELIKELTQKGINCQYGDAEDGEFLDEINIAQAKAVISTIPDHEANMFLLKKVRAENEDTVVILLSYNIDEAIALYEKGASYVILPHFIGGQFAAQLTKETGFNVSKLHSKRAEHIAYLKERKVLGHAHPKWAHNLSKEA